MALSWAHPGMRTRAWHACGLVVVMIAVAVVGALVSHAVAADAPPGDGPAQVRIVQVDGTYQLRVNGEPFFVKGAGIEFGSQEALKAHGGNSFRTWRTDNGSESGQQVLDRAHRNGLRVAMGISVGSERHGFDYDNADAVAAQLARIESEVRRYKDHPALLMWVAGNELNLETTNPRVWDAVDEIARMIHRIDPNHPVMTTLAGFSADLIDLLKTRASALDLIGVQVYGDIVRLPDQLHASGWTGPYIVTEWGPTGHWEVPLTDWGAPIEDHSTRKAELLLQRYQQHILADPVQSLGSYVFLWGHKQERTPTWYGMFLPSGEPTAAADAMQYSWTGAWPEQRSPSIAAIRLDDRTAEQSIVLHAGDTYQAQVTARSRSANRLTYRWQVLAESAATSVGGDHEAVPATIEVDMQDDRVGGIAFTAPPMPGAYRLFVDVLDDAGRAAHANVPFRVESPPVAPGDAQ